MNNYIRKILYLGPDGSNSQLSCVKMTEKLGLNAEIEAVSTISKTIEILNNSSDDIAAILPVENSIEGVVRETIDNLIRTELFIQAEYAMPICHCLLSKGSLKDVKIIVSHAQAIAQCKKYITENFNQNIEIIPYSSTSAAAEFVSKKDNSYAAIATSLCADLYGLNILDNEINDNKDNKTRFILVSKKDLKIHPKTRSSIAFATENKPGALLSVLEIFKKYNLNCIYLESRPSKKVFGEYIFYADIDKGENEISPALNEIDKQCTFYRLLGSYTVV